MAVSQEQQAPDQHTIDSAREQRADLHVVLVSLEEALAAPAPGRAAPWASRVHDRLVEVAAAFERHIAVTEGPKGLFDNVLRASPRLANGVERLRAEHGRIRGDIADLLVDVRELTRSEGPGADTLREQVLGLLTALARHRQLGADLVYECYAVDIGGGD